MSADPFTVTGLVWGVACSLAGSTASAATLKFGRPLLDEIRGIDHKINAHMQRSIIAAHYETVAQLFTQLNRYPDYRQQVSLFDRWRSRRLIGRYRSRAAHLAVKEPEHWADPLKKSWEEIVKVDRAWREIADGAFDTYDLERTEAFAEATGKRLADAAITELRAQFAAWHDSAPERLEQTLLNPTHGYAATYQDNMWRQLKTVPNFETVMTRISLQGIQRGVDAANEGITDANKGIADVKRTLAALLASQDIQNPTEEERRGLQDTLVELLSTTKAERRSAAEKLTADTPDPQGAVDDLKRLAAQQEHSVTDAAKTWKQIGSIAFLTDTHEARDAYERATQLTPEDAGAWNQLGHLDHRLGDLGRAEAAYKRVQALVNSYTDERVVAIALGNLGLIEQTRGNLEAAEDYHKRSLALNEALGRKEGLANQLGNLGVIEQRRGNLEAAEDYHKRSLALEEALGRKEGMAGGLGNLGLIERTRGNLETAEDYLKRSLALEEALGRKEGMAIQLGNLGLIERTRGNLETAEDYHKCSLALDEALGRKEGMANQLGNLGLIERTRGNLETAEDYHKRSLALEEALGRKEGMANQLGNLGLIERTRGNLETAEDYHKRSLALNEELGRKEGMAIQLNDLGLVAHAQGQAAKAAEYGRMALAILKEMDSALAATIKAWLDDLNK